MQPLWSKLLTRPLTLRNGTVLRTLRDARHFIAALPEDFRYRPAWQDAAKLLLKAAESGSGSQAIEDATLQMQRALLLERRLLT